MARWIVENSAAPGAIGDTIAAFPALHAGAWEYPLEVYLSSEPCRELLVHPQIAVLPQRPDNAGVLDVQKLFPSYAHTGVALTRAYMVQMGLNALAQAERPPEVILGVGLNEKPQEYFDILLAPFSASDNGTNTKLWPEENWYVLINFFLKMNQKLGILGTSKDQWALGKEHCVLDRPLPEVCRMVRNAKATICVDNGINWICQGMIANEICFLPQTQHPAWTGNPQQNGINLTVRSSTDDVMGALKFLGGLS